MCSRVCALRWLTNCTCSLLGRPNAQGPKTSGSGKNSEANAEGSKAAKGEVGKVKDALDDMFDSANIKGKSGARKTPPPLPADKAAGLLCAPSFWP